jgi:hypothetical protein
MPTQHPPQSSHGLCAPAPTRGPQRLRWRTSSASGGGGCVEVALLTRTALLRDSRDPDGPVLHLPAPAWIGFLAQVRAEALTDA